MFQQGSGVQFLGTRLSANISKRIEWLGKMNDRHTTCLANNDNLGLLELASEYEERGMTQTANKIRLEVANTKEAK